MTTLTRIPPRIHPPRLWANLAPPPLPELLLAVALLPLVLVALVWCVACDVVLLLCPRRARFDVREEVRCVWCDEPSWKCSCVDIGEPVGRAGR